MLNKVTELADRYGMHHDDLFIAKAQGNFRNDADRDLRTRVQQIPEDVVPTVIERPTGCVVIGATVWSTAKTMKAQGGMIQPLYDVVLVDEASQLKLPEATIALSSATPQATIILAGDDKQLPPIIQGTYPEQHAHLLTSVFAFVRHVAEEHHLTNRVLFLLEENFRMNDPLTQYPSHVLYGGRFVATKPAIRIQTQPAVNPTGDRLLDLLLDPLRPVLLCRYKPPQSFTARNPIEARLAAAIVEHLRTILISQETGVLYEPAAFAKEACAVLSPHRAQNSIIRQELVSAGFDPRGVDGSRPMPIVDTVDKLQGQERDVVVVSYGVADEEYAEAEAGFLLSRNRFNVAATRARHKLIVLCSDPVLEVVPTDQTVLIDSMMLKEFRRYCSDGSTIFHYRLAPFGAVPITVQWKSF